MTRIASSKTLLRSQGRLARDLSAMVGGGGGGNCVFETWGLSYFPSLWRSPSPLESSLKSKISSILAPLTASSGFTIGFHTVPY